MVNYIANLIFIKWSTHITVRGRDDMVEAYKRVKVYTQLIPVISSWKTHVADVMSSS